MKFLILALFLSFYNVVGFAKTTKLKICGKRLEVDIADTDSSREKGLMYRKSMPENYGMLFVYDNEQPMSFWMKNTFIPLSIAFFDKEKKLINILDMKPLDTSKIYPSQKPAQFAIEVNQGWYTKNKVDVGCKFEYDF